MQVFVDEQTYEPKGGPDQTVGQLAAEVGQAEPHRPRMVVALSCDGQRVGQADLERTLARPARTFETLQLQTQPLGPLVRNILAETIDLFEQADQARLRAADLLTQGGTENAMESLRKFIGVWRQVQDAMVVCAQALGCRLDDLGANGRGLPEIFEALRARLDDLKGAMTGHDHVVVGDLLRYEFEQPLADWLAVLHRLRQEAEALTD